MRLTTSINEGFLNPNINGTEGSGYVSFQVNARPDLTTGTIINNIATVEFDNNPGIQTPLCSNGIDKQKPTSNVLPITQKINDSTYMLRWTAGDANAGVFFCHIYVSVNDSAYREIIRSDIDSTRFSVRQGRLYKFYSIAEDYVGNVEDVPGVPDQVLSTALPVDLVEFKAYKQNKMAMLQWTIVTERDNLGYEIQRGTDGINFTRIGWIAAMGNISSRRTYFFTDSVPLRGNNFYRFKQTDIGGNYTFSPVRKLDFETASGFTISPNPVRNEIVMLFEDGRNKQVRITDMMGRVLWSRNNVKEFSLSVSLPGLSAGLYLVNVTDDEGKQSVQRFMKE